ncbi:Ribokinase-like protein [Atractiella rhizophila]|nr:Ribokinase-like protein [Atractiella rhizophila]
MSSPALVGLGNPLLDIQVRNGEAVLEKYNLKANDAILVDEKQASIYDHIEKEYETAYVAGGAAQNACRMAQYVLPEGSTAFIGCVGKDEFASKLEEANKREGLKSAYMFAEDAPTGACAVIITGHHRSLVTRLGAAESFKPSHFEKPEIKALLDGAKYFYMEGYFLTHGLESAKLVAKRTAESSQMFAMNLSAPFIPQFFKSQVDEIMPYVDILIGNETEAEHYAAAAGWNTKDLGVISNKLAHLPKANNTRPRLVIITQGPENTFVSSPSMVAQPELSSHPHPHKSYAVTSLASDSIVDTNGAGDAFAAGFMGGLVRGLGVDECIELGHRCGGMCVQQVGPQLKWPKEDVLKGLI